MDPLAHCDRTHLAVALENYLGLNMTPRMVNVEGAEFSVVDEGQGPVLLFVHGFPLDHTMWEAQIAYFKSSFRVLAPDLRGFGRSTVTPGTVTMSQFADDLAGILEQLEVDRPVVFCGLSMGGYVAWQFWKLYATRLRGMVLCDTKAAADTVEVARGRELMATSVEQNRDTQEIAENMAQRLFSPTTVGDCPAIIEKTKNVIARTSPEGIAAAQRGMAQREDARPWVAEIELPCLLLGGADDLITPPAEMNGISQALPHARFAIIECAGHIAPLEQAAATNSVIADYLHEIA